MIKVALAAEEGTGFLSLSLFQEAFFYFYSVPPVGVNPSRGGDTKPRV